MFNLVSHSLAAMLFHVFGICREFPSVRFQELQAFAIADRFCPTTSLHHRQRKPRPRVRARSANSNPVARSPHSDCGRKRALLDSGHIPALPTPSGPVRCRKRDTLSAALTYIRANPQVAYRRGGHLVDPRCISAGQPYPWDDALHAGIFVKCTNFAVLAVCWRPVSAGERIIGIAAHEYLGPYSAKQERGAEQDVEFSQSLDSERKLVRGEKRHLQDCI